MAGLEGAGRRAVRSSQRSRQTRRQNCEPDKHLRETMARLCGPESKRLKEKNNWDLGDLFPDGRTRERRGYNLWP